MPQRHLHEANRASWNEATRAHNSHKHDQAAYFREGGSTLFPEEVELLGDIRGLSLVHLQCNAGQDTLSLARLGATVTGVDIGDEAVDCARRLSVESGIPATFVRADVYDWLEQTAQGSTHYDLAFSSYGVLCWLSDLTAWARGIAGVLKPGGRFVLVEFHPCYAMIEEGWRLAYDYMGGKHLQFEGVGDYVALTGSIAEGQYVEGVQNFQNPHPSHEFCWGLADVVTAALEAGLVLKTLREYPYSNGFKKISDMRELPGRRFTVPDGMPTLPLMFGIVAQRM